MSFSEEIEKLDWEDIRSTIEGTTAREVERSLQTERRTIRDVLALLSPVAESYLESMAQIAHNVTVRRFGRIIQMFAPVYVSSECTNSCVYCGFNRHNAIERATLTFEEAVREGEVLHREGFRHVLLVSGESPKHVPVDLPVALSLNVFGPCLRRFPSKCIPWVRMTTERSSHRVLTD